MIVRSSKLPMIIDKLPHRSWWVADVDEGKEFYIQISADIENPQWIRLNKLIDTMPHLIEEALVSLKFE